MILDKPIMSKRFKCKVCGNNANKILPVLKPTPPEDTFTKDKNNLKKIPLDTSCCSFCGLVFLNTQYLVKT